MGDSRAFLDNLANLRLVMNVALEHVQSNREPFLKRSSPEELQQAQILISKVQSLARQLEQEFQGLESSAATHRRLM